MKFEWDESKNRDNRHKHGVAFEDAQTAFLDEFGRLIPDPDHSVGEERFILLGMSIRHGLLVVCHSEPESDLIRIISARRAVSHERRQYEEFIDA